MKRWWRWLDTSARRKLSPTVSKEVKESDSERSLVGKFEVVACSQHQIGGIVLSSDLLESISVVFSEDLFSRRVGDRIVWIKLQIIELLTFCFCLLSNDWGCRLDSSSEVVILRLIGPSKVEVKLWNRKEDKRSTVSQYGKRSRFWTCKLTGKGEFEWSNAPPWENFPYCWKGSTAIEAKIPPRRDPPFP